MAQYIIYLRTGVGKYLHQPKYMVANYIKCYIRYNYQANLSLTCNLGCRLHDIVGHIIVIQHPYNEGTGNFSVS